NACGTANPMADNNSQSSWDPLAELARLIGQASLHSPADSSFRKETASQSYDDGFREETASQSYDDGFREETASQSYDDGFREETASQSYDDGFREETASQSCDEPLGVPPADQRPSCPSVLEQARESIEPHRGDRAYEHAH